MIINQTEFLYFLWNNIKAFEALDTDKKGYLLPEEISNYLREEGEPFLQEELEEFLSAAVDPSKGKIFYKGR